MAASRGREPLGMNRVSLKVVGQQVVETPPCLRFAFAAPEGMLADVKVGDLVKGVGDQLRKQGNLILKAPSLAVDIVAWEVRVPVKCGLAVGEVANFTPAFETENWEGVVELA